MIWQALANLWHGWINHLYPLLATPPQCPTAAPCGRVDEALGEVRAALAEGIEGKTTLIAAIDAAIDLIDNHGR